MKRREFIGASAAAALSPGLLSSNLFAHEPAGKAHRTFATPADAMASPREEILYVTAIRANSAADSPDYLATVDVDPSSPTYSKVVHRVAMPGMHDELHHFGWNACASCHGERARRYLIVPGLGSNRIHIIDTKDPRAPKLTKVIEPDEVVGKSKLTAPHTVHCLADGTILISMLGNTDGEAPGGFLVLTEDFEVAGPWDADTTGMNFNYDYWYQPRHNVMVSSEWAAPNTVRRGFHLEDVQAGKYGQHIHFWDWNARKITQSIDLGDAGRIPLEVRFHHNPDSTHGFVGAALSSAMWHWDKKDGKWHAEKVIQVEPVETKGWPFPVPGLITDLLVSMDDRWLYFSNWLHGDIRQYDISDPSNPRLAGQIWLGGVIGKAPQIQRDKLTGGPQMLQLSLDGKRLYVTSSLYSVWDNQFYPDMKDQGSYMLQIDCDTKSGGLAVNPDFFVDFGKEPGGPARAHEMRFPHGDSTSDIWM